MNTIHLIGRLGQDPETTTLESGATVTKFSLATSEQWKDKQGQKQERTDWHNVEFWGKGGEVVAQFLKKGDPIIVTGSLVYDKWEDKNGQKRTTAKIKAANFEFVPSTKTDGPRQEAPKAAQPEPQPEASESLPF